jgi:hypothetical protein
VSTTQSQKAGKGMSFSEFLTTDEGKVADGRLWGRRAGENAGREGWEIPSYIGFGGPALLYALLWSRTPRNDLEVFARRELDERERLHLEAQAREE